MPASWRSHDTWVWLLRLLGPLGALVLEGLPALIGAILIQEAALWLARRLTDGSYQVAGVRLFAAAYGLRVALTLPSH